MDLRRYLFAAGLGSLLVLSACNDDTEEPEVAAEDESTEEATEEESTEEATEEPTEEETEEPTEEETEEPAEESTEEPAKEMTEADEIKQTVEAIIEEDFDMTDIDSIEVNENAGLQDGSYIVLPHLIWNQKNGADMTKEMLTMYSDHLAAKLAEENVSEVAIFWLVPYHNEESNTAKMTYENTADGMAIVSNEFFGLEE